MSAILTDFHTHTSLCDGRDTPRDMAEAAFKKGFTAFGFSGHSIEISGYGMTEENEARYREEIAALKVEYADRIALYMGLEIDSTQPRTRDGLDYTIGSAHHVRQGSAYYCVDETPEALKEGIEKGFRGDPYAMARAYFEEVARCAKEIRPDILGHFDLLTKFNAGGCFFDITNKAYRDAALDALEEAVRLGCIVEVNTGAMARGYTLTPYPARFILERLHELGGMVMINSDAHNTEMIGHAFAQMQEMLRDIGFITRMELTRGGFAPVAL